MKQESLGTRIKELRQQYGLSQEQIAKYLGMDQSMLSLIEQGKRSISVAALEKLAELFCIPAYSLAYEDYESNKYELAFRANKLEEEDMFILAKVNRIILNQKFMDNLKEIKK